MSDAVVPEAPGQSVKHLQLQSTCTSKMRIAHYVMEFIHPCQGSTEEESGFKEEISVTFHGLQQVIMDSKKNRKKYKHICSWVPRRITECLRDMHVKKGFHGNLNPSCIFCIAKEKRIVIADPCQATEKAQDIRALGSLYYTVLTAGKSLEPSIQSKDFLCAEKELAADLIRKMTDAKEPITDLQEVLKHPFHWPPLEKIRFLKDTFEYVKRGRKKQQSEDSQRRSRRDLLNDASHKIFPKEGWIEKLVLTEDEMWAIDKKQTSGHRIEVASDTIKKLASKGHNDEPCQSTTGKKSEESATNGRANPEGGKKPRRRKNKSGAAKKPNDEAEQNGESSASVNRIPKTGEEDKDGQYDATSLYHLIRFIRNFRTHYWENSKNVNLAFGESDAGYWEFFSSRFPELMGYVYEKMKDAEFCQLADA